MKKYISKINIVILITLSALMIFLLVNTTKFSAQNFSGDGLYEAKYDTPGLTGIGKTMTLKNVSNSILYQKIDNEYYVYLSYNYSEIDNVELLVSNVNRKYYFVDVPFDLITSKDTYKTIIISISDDEIDKQLIFKGNIKQMGNKSVSFKIKHLNFNKSDKKPYKFLPLSYEVHYMLAGQRILEDSKIAVNKIEEVKLTKFFDKVEKVDLKNNKNEITNQIKYVVIQKDKNEKEISKNTYNKIEDFKVSDIKKETAYIQQTAYYKNAYNQVNNLSKTIAVLSNGGDLDKVEISKKITNNSKFTISNEIEKTKLKEMKIIPPIIILIIVAYITYIIVAHKRKKLTKNNNKK